jgi:hypothetical protein
MVLASSAFSTLSSAGRIGVPHADDMYSVHYVDFNKRLDGEYPSVLVHLNVDNLTYPTRMG